jgi:hypothetical protein
MSATKGTVIVIPGNFASSLDSIWINPIALALGRFANLALPDSGDIEATGLLPGYYSLLQNALCSSGFDVRPFPYDWRQDVDKITPILQDLIVNTEPPIYLIAHSFGAHIARRAIQNLAIQHSPEWVLSNIQSLILMGPANYGTFAAALGLAGATGQLPLFDILPPSPPYVQRTLATFPALYQVLPWDPSKLPSLNDTDHNLRSAGFWRGKIDTDLLYAAIPPGEPAWAARIDTAFFRDHVTIILGDAVKTAGGVTIRTLGGKLAMTVDPQYNMEGDGYVPRVCSLLDERPVAYLASGIGHIHLPIASDVIDAIVDIFNGKVPTSVSRYGQ